MRNQRTLGLVGCGLVLAVAIVGCLSIPVPDSYRKDKKPVPSPAVTTSPVVIPTAEPLATPAATPVFRPTFVPFPVRTPDAAKPAPSVLVPIPAPIMVPAQDRVFLPLWGIAGAPFIVRAWFPAASKVSIETDSHLRVGFMGWNRFCPCKEVALTFQNTGKRRVAFYVDGVLAEETFIEIR